MQTLSDITKIHILLIYLINPFIDTKLGIVKTDYKPEADETAQQLKIHPISMITTSQKTLPSAC